MRLTESAARAVLEVMASQQLNPKEFALYLCNYNGACSMEFSNKAKGTIEKFHGLTVVVGPGLDMTDVEVDFVENDGKRGLLFRDG